MADKSIHQRSKIYKKNSQRIGLLINTNNTKVSVRDNKRNFENREGVNYTQCYTFTSATKAGKRTGSY
jgi:hypothetical protein